MINYWSKMSSQRLHAENMGLQLHFVQKGNVTDINILMERFPSNHTSLITVIKNIVSFNQTDSIEVRYELRVKDVASSFMP